MVNRRRTEETYEQAIDRPRNGIYDAVILDYFGTPSDPADGPPSDAQVVRHDDRDVGTWCVADRWTGRAYVECGLPTDGGAFCPGHLERLRSSR